MFKKRIHTSESAKNILLDLKKKTGLLPNALCRIAIIFSLSESDDFSHKDVADISRTSKGLEFLPETLFGEQNVLLYTLIKESDWELIQHIEHGLTLLKNQYQLAGNKEKFLEII